MIVLFLKICAPLGGRVMRQPLLQILLLISFTLFVSSNDSMDPDKPLKELPPESLIEITENVQDAEITTENSNLNARVGFKSKKESLDYMQNEQEKTTSGRGFAPWINILIVVGSMGGAGVVMVAVFFGVVKWRKMKKTESRKSPEIEPATDLEAPIIQTDQDLGNTTGSASTQPRMSVETSDDDTDSDFPKLADHGETKIGRFLVSKV